MDWKDVVDNFDIVEIKKRGAKQEGFGFLYVCLDGFLYSKTYGNSRLTMNDIDNMYNDEVVAVYRRRDEDIARGDYLAVVNGSVDRMKKIYGGDNGLYVKLESVGTKFNWSGYVSCNKWNIKNKEDILDENVVIEDDEGIRTTGRIVEVYDTNHTRKDFQYEVVDFLQIYDNCEPTEVTSVYVY